MMDYFLFVVLPNFKNLLEVCLFAGCVSSIVYAIYFLSEHSTAICDSDRKHVKDIGKKCVLIIIATTLMLFVDCFIPTKKDLLMLKIGSTVSKLQGVDQIPQKIVDKLNKLLDDEE